VDISLLQRIFLVLFLGISGALIANRLRLPSAFFLGPIIAIGLYQVFVGALPENSSLIRVIVQIAVGIMLGSNFSELTSTTLKRIIKPGIIIGIFMLGGGLLIGTVMSKLFPNLELMTYILGTTPGGQSEMVLIAEDMGISTETVLVLQLVRSQFVVVFLIPFLLSIVQKRMSKDPSCN